MYYPQMNWMRNEQRVWGSSFSGSSWDQDTLIPNSDNAIGTSGPPAVAVYQNKVFCVHQGRANDGWLWCSFCFDNAEAQTILQEFVTEMQLRRGV